MAENSDTGDAPVKDMDKPGKDGEAGHARIGWLLEILTSYLVVALVVVSLFSPD